jgi:CheY-like chemotaxis protein
MALIEIMLVEDDPGDARLVQEAFRESQIKYNLHIVRDGMEALQILKESRASGDGTLPRIIFLDLNLPRMAGKQLLEAIKSDRKLRHIPVIVFSTSDNEDDIKTTYDLQANCYITKPNDFDDYREAIRIIEQFWLKLAQLP